MITIRVDEGECFDKLAIYSVKSNLNTSEQNDINLVSLQNSLINQLGKDEFYRIKQSEEYIRLYEVNEFLFKQINKSKLGLVKADFIDYLNWVRYIWKQELHKNVLNSKLTEIKIGYNWDYVKIRDTFAICLIDAEDKNKFNNEKLSLHNGYVVTTSKNGEFIHRLVMPECFSKREMVIDHINRNKWDNRKCNLRLVTRSENAKNIARKRFKNKSGYRGVNFDKKKNKWDARIRNGKHTVFIGSFEKKEYAAIAYDIYANSFFGSNAVLNIENSSEKDLKTVLNIIKNPKKNKSKSKYYGVCYRKSKNKWLGWFS